MNQNQSSNNYDEVLKQVLEQTGGALAVSLRKTAKILGLSARTLYNRRGRLPAGLRPIESLRPRNFFNVNDIAMVLCSVGQPAAAPARGAPTKAERISAHANGMSVKEYRRHRR